MSFSSLERFDSAVTEVVREDFTQWSLDWGVPPREPKPNQQPVYYPDAGVVQWGSFAAARFHYCLVVDERSLESLSREYLFVAIVAKDRLPLWHPRVLRGQYNYEDVTDDLIPWRGTQIKTWDGAIARLTPWWNATRAFLTRTVGDVEACRVAHRRFTTAPMMRAIGAETLKRDIIRGFGKR